MWITHFSATQVGYSTKVKFGEHLTIDGYGGNYDRLNNRAVVLGCLTDLLEKLGMHALSEPFLLNAPDNQIKDPGGWSGFVIIAESHIAVHTFPKRGFVSADIYTCRSGMGTELVMSYFKDAFALTDVETHFIERGTRYPDTNIV